MASVVQRSRFRVTAGPHKVGVTFVNNGRSLLETKRKPYNVHYNAHRHPRLTPAIYQVSITGPYKDAGIHSTPSRRRIFITYPESSAEEESAARQIIKNLMRRAYRRPVTEQELAGPMRFYRAGREEGGFEAGIERALSAILVSPRFLFKIERDPEGLESGEPYRLSDMELASRLSFFLWSSIPDEKLLAAAESGELREPGGLEKQVRRMLADERASALATDFAGQWLHLRNLSSETPDARLYPDFGENLRRAMRRETELHFERMVSEDRSVLDLIRADYTYLNERLAKHYGIPHVYGSRFRRVDLPEGTGFTPLMAVSWVRKPRIGDSDSGLPPPRGSGTLTSLQLVRKLVEYGADVDFQKKSGGGGRRRISAKGTTAFLCAAAKADMDYMKLLLELGANPTIRNAKGQNGLMMAAGIDESPEADGAGTKDEHLAAVEFLLELGVYDIDATANNGETAMHGAAYKMLPRVVHLLDEHGADIEVWAKKSEEGRTPLSIAQGYRPGNFKPSPETIAAIEEVMRAHGITPPPPPEKDPENY